MEHETMSEQILIELLSKVKLSDNLEFIKYAPGCQLSDKLIYLLW